MEQNLTEQTPIQQPSKEFIYHEEFKVKTPVNINGVTVYGNNEVFVLEPNQQTYIQTRLVIDKKTGLPRETDFNETFENPFDFKKSYSVFLGIITIFERSFLVLGDEVQQVCVLDNNGIFTLSSASFVPFEQDTEFYNSDKGTQLIGLIINLRRLLSQGFYFSYTYDLTITKSKRAQNHSIDTRYMWNYHLCKDLIAFDIGAPWYVALIQGHVGHFRTSVYKKPLKCYLISRRSWMRSGTRNNSMGIDDKGNVANFVETEQIIHYNDYFCSHVQLRGNPPVFFEQTASTISTQIRTTRTATFTNHAFLEHMKILAGDWSYLLCLNLLSSTKKEEQAVTEIFENLIRANPFNRIKYEFFDYLAVTKSGKLDKINILIHKLRAMLENMAFFVESESSRDILVTQKGVIRTSCIDGLDRTNAIQTKIAIAVLDSFLKTLGVNLQTELTQDPVLQLDAEESKQNHPLIIAFKDLWNENGNALSVHYTGTISMTASTKGAKNNLLGFLDYGLKSINVFTVNPLEDNQRQEGIDLLLNQHPSSGTALEKTIKNSLKARQSEFAYYQDFSVFVVTWNVANFVPSKTYDLTDLFNFEGNESPDIVAIGLQEIVELSASNVVVGSNVPNDLIWKEVIQENLKKIGNYVFVQKEILVGLLLILFIKEDIKDRIGNIGVDVVKTGLAGALGNKGAVFIKLNLDHSSLCFINCHMEAGEGDKTNTVRLANITDFHQKAFQQGVIKRSDEQIAKLDYKFFFGDMNFRLVSENEDIRGIIEKYSAFTAEGNTKDAEHLFNWLLGEDQLGQSRDLNEYLSIYHEGKIDFLPTYKYDQNSDNYDTSKKMRPPAWTDRILWNCTDGEATQMFYTRREYKSSDHRPVVTYFRIKAKQIDAERKQAIAKELYQQGFLAK